jgi:hypothetical protein
LRAWILHIVAGGPEVRPQRRGWSDHAWQRRGALRQARTIAKREQRKGNGWREKESHLLADNFSPADWSDR